MPRKDISLLSRRELALSVLSKLLYFVADRIDGMEELVCYHHQLLQRYLNQSSVVECIDTEENVLIESIPWNDILDSISLKHPLLIKLSQTKRFSVHEIRYMCAMMCGISGKEYGLITGFKSHYNISYTIRQKFGLPVRVTNLRIFLQKLSNGAQYESLQMIVQK